MGLLDEYPRNGGLTLNQLSAPFGLRAYKLPDGSYGGEMMPKGYGWLGPVKTPDGNTMTEFSIGDDKGDFPTLVPNTTPQNLARLLRGEVTKEQAELAQKWADNRRAMGLSPFREIWE